MRYSDDKTKICLNIRKNNTNDAYLWMDAEKKTLWKWIKQTNSYYTSYK